MEKFFSRQGKKNARNTKVRQPCKLQVEQLEARECPALTTVAPYVLPVAAGVQTQAIMTVGESVTDSNSVPDGAFHLVGIPDGMGAYDNGNGTITVLLNHELSAGAGAVREHGTNGAFVSKLIINKATHEVVEGDDLIKSLKLWVPGTGYVSGTTIINRLCSADLPAVSAFYNASTGLGTQARIFMSGEETSGGRGFAHLVTGAEAGTSYELPRSGKMAFENLVASPYAQDKTIVASLDDSNRSFSSEGASDPSEVYFYIGNKQSTGNDIEKAGLTNGLLYGMKVTGAVNELSVVNGATFALVNLGNVENTTAAQLQTDSITQQITQFRRVEDGAFDPNNPNDFYFVTTDQFNGNSKLWRVRFSDITNPTAGGTIEAVVDGSDGVQMLDNITIDSLGRVLMQEDPGNQTHIAKIWTYDIATDSVLLTAQHNSAFFVSGNPGFLTQDEESSGIIDASALLGDGWYLFDVQAHYSIPGELVQGGQLLAMHIGATAGLHQGKLVVLGTDDCDNVHIKVKHNNTIEVKVDGTVIATFARGDVGSIAVNTYGGNDNIHIDAKLDVPTFLVGGAGNDDIHGGSGSDLIVGGAGNDHLHGNDGRDLIFAGLGADVLNGGKGDDLLIGGATTYDNSSQLLKAIHTYWSTTTDSYNTRVAKLRAGTGVPKLDHTTVFDDGKKDKLHGDAGLDWFWGFFNDIGDNKPGEFVN